MEPLDVPAGTPPTVIDPAVVAQLLSDRGVIYIDPVTLEAHRMLGVPVSEGMMDQRGLKGAGDADLLGEKDNLLRELDTRLTKILDL